MRKILSVVAALLLFAVTQTNAEVKQQLTISGTTVDAVVDRITFSGDHVVLHFTGGDSQTADMDAVVLCFDYAAPVSIESLDLSVPNAEAPVTIYDEKGKLRAVTTAGKAKAALAAPSLRNGVYLVKTGQQAVKVMKSPAAPAAPAASSVLSSSPVLSSSQVLSHPLPSSSVLSPRNTSINQALLTLTNGEQRYYDTQSLEAIDINNTTGAVTLTTTDQQQEVFSATIATLAFSKAKGSSAGIVISEAHGWLESAYVKFSLMEGADTYHVYVKGGQYADFTKIDNELVRNYGTYGRADAVGLKAGTYTMKVVPVADGNELNDKAATTDVLTVKNYDRTGYAHFNHSGVGAYNDDGTLKTGAKVFYVTKQTAKTISTNVAGAKENPCVGIQAIIEAYQKGLDTTPIAFRFIGLIEKNDLDYLGSSAEGLQVKGNKEYSEMNFTFEGIGDDATMRGFGFLLRNAKSVEMRNFAVMRCMDDGISLDTDNSNIWVHHLDIFYGKHGSGDHEKGDGSCDTKGDSKYCTFSYCRYWDTGKSNLFGMKSESGPNYLSYHHNWLDHSDSRHPRVRTMTVHVWNNYFDNVAKYGVGATYGASVFVENNYFLKTKKPILSSKQGTDGLGSGTFSGENGGMIKAYGNYIDRSIAHFSYYTQKNPSSMGYDAYETATRDEQVPDTEKALAGGTTYDNFDTNPQLIYQYTPDAAEDVPAIVTGYYGAGRMNHGDFRYTFANNIGDEEADSAYDTDLASKIDNYKPDLIGIFGEEALPSDPSVPSDPSDPSDPAESTILVSFDGAPSNNMFTVGGDYGDGKITYDGTYYKKGVKLNSKGSITFTPKKNYQMTLILATAKPGRDVKLNGTTTTVGGTENAEGAYYQMQPIALTANTEYVLTKGSGESIVMLIILEEE
ncbi:MAG: pectate lyase [Prevotella sp.]|nr:pectate lyase [Prevotella sp.]